MLGGVSLGTCTQDLSIHCYSTDIYDSRAIRRWSCILHHNSGVSLGLEVDEIPLGSYRSSEFMKGLKERDDFLTRVMRLHPLEGV